ncbi:WSCD family member GA21586-like, partial [Patella vulgata]|uniref:WSCD family member GA21586-like n=1 Tax=Patella vulgata TaxID=6465 RepID=UPI0024A8FB12
MVKDLGFAKTPLPVTALASYPGSGNSWTRHLLQKSTVIKTHGTKKDRIAYQRAVLLMRNPFEAQWSLFNLKMSKSHTNITDKKRYCTRDMFVLFYDDLLHNKENKLRELLPFLDVDVD